MSDDYNPQQTRIVLFPGDKRTPSLVVPTITAFTAATAILYDPGDSDVTSLYTTGAAAFSGNEITAPTIGIGSGTIVPGDYRLYLTGTYDEGSITTWYWPVSVSAKVGGT